MFHTNILSKNAIFALKSTFVYLSVRLQHPIWRRLIPGWKITGIYLRIEDVFQTYYRRLYSIVKIIVCWSHYSPPILYPVWFGDNSVFSLLLVSNKFFSRFQNENLMTTSWWRFRGVVHYDILFLLYTSTPTYGLQFFIFPWPTKGQKNKLHHFRFSVSA